MSEIKIKIELEGGGEGTSSSSSTSTGISSSQAKENASSFAKLAVAAHVAGGLANQAVNMGISNYGFYTGNTVMQERMEHAKSIGGQVLGIGVAFAANPILGAVALAQTTASNVNDYLKQVRALERQNYDANQLARRAGYLSNQNR